LQRTASGRKTMRPQPREALLNGAVYLLGATVPCPRY